MARLTGLKAAFNAAKVRGVLDQFQKQFDEKSETTLKYVGETFVNAARDSGNYSDRTGNLRSSIGYILLRDGKVIDKNFATSERGSDRKTGLSKGKTFADQVTKDYPDGLVLIGVAGMEYAAAVEANGYDVITGSAPTGELLKSIFNGIKF